MNGRIVVYMYNEERKNDNRQPSTSGSSLLTFHDIRLSSLLTLVSPVIECG
jgi:hypothetical protein